MLRAQQAGARRLPHFLSVPVAHKTGNITRIHHDAAIVYGPRPYILVVLVRGIEDKTRSAAVIAEISKAAYQTAARR